MTIWHHQPPIASARRNSCHLQTWCSPAKISEMDSLKRLWPMHKPYSIGWRRPAHWCWGDHAFWWGLCKNWGGWWNHMWPSAMMSSWRVLHLGRGPWKDEPGHPSQWRPRCGPHRGAHQAAGPCRCIYRRGDPHREAQWRTSNSNSHSQQAQQRSQISSLCSTRRKKRERCPIATSWLDRGSASSLVSDPCSANPLTLGELRQWCHSQSVGGRRAQHWRAKECRWAVQEKSDLTSSPGSPEPGPKVALPPGFKGVVACLLRDSPLLSPIEAPWKQGSQICWWYP